jgi:hypothetical protein
MNGQAAVRGKERPVLPPVAAGLPAGKADEGEPLPGEALEAAASGWQAGLQMQPLSVPFTFDSGELCEAGLDYSLEPASPSLWDAGQLGGWWQF